MSHHQGAVSGVDRSLDSDLKQLKMTLKLGGLLKIPKESVDQLFNELREQLSEELITPMKPAILIVSDTFMRRTLVDYSGRSPELSSRRVLTLILEEGDHISEVVPERYSQQTIDLIGQHLFQTMADQLFVFKAIRGDPMREFCVSA